MPKGNPLFGKKEYPLFSVVDRLLDLPGAKSGKFNILILGGQQEPDRDRPVWSNFS
jgi:hypothetical protein